MGDLPEAEQRLSVGTVEGMRGERAPQHIRIPLQNFVPNIPTPSVHLTLSLSGFFRFLFLDHRKRRLNPTFREVG